jgi:hypothetical protein
MVATVLDLQRAVGNRVTSDLIGRGAVQRDLSSDLKADLEKDFPSSVDDEYATRLEGLRTTIELAQSTERADASYNKKLLAAASASLSKKDYGHFLAWLRAHALEQVEGKGPDGAKTSRHERVETADVKIREKIGELIKGSVAGGAAGRVAVLDEKQWNLVIEGYVSNQLERHEAKLSNAFTAPDGYIYIRADRGDAGTLIHESVHFYSPDACLRTLGEPLNEGLTEYFARLVMPTEVASTRTKYPKAFAFAVELMAVVSQDVAAKAYFQGDIAGLEGSIPAERWQALVRSVRGTDEKKFSDESDVDWEAASAHLKGAKFEPKAESAAEKSLVTV